MLKPWCWNRDSAPCGPPDLSMRSHPLAAAVTATVFAVVMALILPRAAAADELSGITAPQPFEARYHLFRNGKEAAQSEVRLEHLGGQRYRYRLTAEGSRGLARFLGFDSREETEFLLQDGRLRPLHYESMTDIVGRSRHQTIRFDWDNRKAYVRDDDEQHVLDLPDNALDPLSAQLILMAHARRDSSEVVIPVVDGDQVEGQRFRLTRLAGHSTALGCQDLIQARRIRENSRRHTQILLAPDLDMIPAGIIRSKTDGDHLEMVLQELIVSGNPVAAAPPCPDGLQDITGQPAH